MTGLGAQYCNSASTCRQGWGRLGEWASHHRRGTRLPARSCLCSWGWRGQLGLRRCRGGLGSWSGGHCGASLGSRGRRARRPELGSGEGLAVQAGDAGGDVVACGR